SWPQPTAQYGHTPATAFTSLIFSAVVAACTGARSRPPPTATPAALAVPTFRKSRRDKLIGAPPRRGWESRCLEFGARQLVPDASHDDDPFRPRRCAAVEAHDIAGVQRVEPAVRVLVADDDGVLAARHVTADVGRTLHADTPRRCIDGHDDQAILLEPIGEALGHGLDLLDRWGKTLGTRRAEYEWSDRQVKVYCDNLRGGA